MRSTRNKTLLALAAFAGLILVGPSAASAQLKVAIIDFQEALLETADMKAQAAKLETKFKPQQDLLEQLSRELQEIQTKLQTAGGNEAARLQNDGTRKQREAQRISEDLQSEVDFERDAILQSGAERMRGVLEKLREERGYDVILDSSAAFSYNSALDITTEATAAYDAAHPAQ
jgi:outer membrane protein